MQPENAYCFNQMSPPQGSARTQCLRQRSFRLPLKGRARRGWRARVSVSSRHGQNNSSSGNHIRLYRDYGGQRRRVESLHRTMYAEAGCSTVIPVRIDKGGQTNLLVLDQPYTTVRILDPTVVDMVSVSDRSFYLSGQDMGRTLIKFFDEKGVALVDLEVMVGPPAGQVIVL
jgi:hypothetical protein